MGTGPSTAVPREEGREVKALAVLPPSNTSPHQPTAHFNWHKKNLFAWVMLRMKTTPGCEMKNSLQRTKPPESYSSEVNNSATGFYCSPVNRNTITEEESKPQLGRGNKCLGGSYLTEEMVGGSRPQRGTQATSRALTSDLSMMHPKLHSQQLSKEMKGAW